jgi:Rnl2 family RNA ligase
VYGELFGNGVQKGIYYSPVQSFYSYDIMIDGLYIDVDKCEELFEQFDFFYAKPLVKGTITECFDYPNEFDSTIPALLGEEHVVDNICEGTVIRPNTITFFPSGSRCIFKNKNPKWSESTKTRKPKTVFVLSDEVMVALEASTAHITLNRLRNVLSKVGNVEQNDFPKVCGLMTKDVIEEFIKDFDINSLEKNDRKVLTKQINKLCGNLLREHFLNIIDGNF